MNTCRTCRRPDISEINKHLGTGKPLRYIVANYGISQGAAQRHKDNCLKAMFAEVIEQKRSGLLSNVDEVSRRILKLEAEFADNAVVQVQLGKLRLEVVDKEAKLTGAYTKERDNPTTIAEIVQQIITRLTADGYSETEIQAVIAKEYVSEAIN